MAIAFGEKTEMTGSGASSYAFTAFSVAAGSLLVGIFSSWSSDHTPPTVSDNVNGGWTQFWFTATGGTDDQLTQCNYFPNAAAGSTTVTFNPPGTPDFGGCVAEFTGIATSPANGSATNAQSADSTTASSGTLAVTFGAEAENLLIAGTGLGSSGTITENAGTEGYTLVDDHESGASAEPYSMVSKIISSGGNQVHTWTTPNDQHASGIAAFKGSAAGGTSLTPPVGAMALTGIASRMDFGIFVPTEV